MKKITPQYQGNVATDLSRAELIQSSLDGGFAYKHLNGSLLTHTKASCTGRRPTDTYIVRNAESEKNIDWTAPANQEISEEIFQKLLDDAEQVLSKKKQVYISHRVIGAESKYALPVEVVTDSPLVTLFTDNMFRPVPSDIKESIFADEEFQLIALPADLVPEKYKNDFNLSSGMAVIMDFDRKIGLVYGICYMGSCKKLLFTVMNYLLPEHGVLPLHSSANEGENGDSALILGLSGTGKTTLSADPNRPLLGDDEHFWSDTGIANMENGCYAKLIDLNPAKEPEIFRITFGENVPVQDKGVIIENTMIYPDGTFDLYDDRLTANSRVSYPLTALQNFKTSSCSGHPKTILFLTADANGILPPVSKLNKEQAKLWFLMGYTSKLAGTEIGVKSPKSAFSRFFGAPFMPRNPEDYTNLLSEKIEAHNANVYLINTGWTAGVYGVGHRIDINDTRAIVNACLDGDLENAEYEENNLFHVAVPKTCPNVDSNILNPRNTWTDKDAYDKKATELAGEFSAYFDKNFSHVGDELKKQCPGK